MSTVVETSYDSQAVVSGTLTPLNTYWHAVGDSRVTSAAGTETFEYVTRRTAGTFSLMYARVSTNTITATTTIRFRKNQVNGNQLLSVGSSTIGEFQDTTHTDSVVAGDKVNYQTSTGGTGTSMTLTILSIAFTASTNTVKRFFHQATSYTPTTTLKFIPISGGGTTTQGTEANAQFKFKTAGTFQNLWGFVDTNTATQTVTVSSRKNTAAGAMALSIATTATGIFEDTTNTDTIASGDVANYGLVVAGGGSGSCSIRSVSAEFSTSTSQSQFALGNANSGPFAVNANTTNYFAVGGFWNATTTESFSQSKALIPFTLSNMEIRAATNTVTAASTLTSRVNGAPGSQSISVTASSIGYFEDTTNKDTVAAGDEINYQLVTGATGTSFSVVSSGMLMSMGRLFSICLLNGIGTGGPFLTNPVG